MNSPINLTEWPHEKIKSKKILELAEEVLHSNEYVGDYLNSIKIGLSTTDIVDRHRCH